MRAAGLSPRSLQAALACWLPVGVWLGAGCSGNSQRGDDIDTGDTETALDTESGTGSDTGSETDTETSQAGWSWIETPQVTGGWFSDIVGRTSEDLLAAGTFFSAAFDMPLLWYDGFFSHLASPMPSVGLRGTGVCASQGGTYWLGTMVADWPETQPRFFSQQGISWDEVAFDSDLCADGSWILPFSTDLSGRSITCLEPAGFAVLVSCYVPPLGPPPGETFIHLIVNDDQGWTNPYSFSTTSDSFPIATLWGLAVDDLFFFVAETDAPGYHFDGVEMTPITPPPGSWFFNGDGGVKAMAGSRASQGTEIGYWVTGTYFDGNLDPGRYRGFVWRSPDGMAWTDVEVPHPADPSTCNEYFHDLWISDQGEVLIVGVCSHGDGSEEALPHLLRFDGSEWEEIAIPPHPLSVGDARGELQRIWGIGGEIFVAAVIDVSGSQLPSILHYQPE